MKYVKQKLYHMNLQKLYSSELKIDCFVLIELSPGCFEIGIVRTNPMDEKKQHTIFILTDSKHQQLPPVFEHDYLPFIIPCIPDVDPYTYPLYAIDNKIIEDLVIKQKQYLEDQKTKAESRYETTIQQYNGNLTHAEYERIFANGMLDVFNKLQQMINELRVLCN